MGKSSIIQFYSQITFAQKYLYISDHKYSHLSPPLPVSLHSSFALPRHFEKHRTEIMTYESQPIPCPLSAPFSCLVTPAVWVSRPPLLSNGDAGPHRLSLLIRLLTLRRARGQTNSLYLCVCVWMESVSVCICLTLYRMHWDSGSQRVGVWTCVYTLCHYVGVWPICFTVSDNDLSLG